MLTALIDGTNTSTQSKRFKKDLRPFDSTTYIREDGQPLLDALQRKLENYPRPPKVTEGEKWTIPSEPDFTKGVKQRFQVLGECPEYYALLIGALFARV